MPKLIALLLFLFLLSQCNAPTKVKIGDQKITLAGPPAPSDLVFIPGNGKITDLYVSVQEEPNINYLTYLRWVDWVYGESYPEVYQEALPKKNTELAEDYPYNDPYLANYHQHPAFSYYPVVGLTWLQIQNYLRWKTDRLNEATLFNLGIMNTNLEQKDEDSFSTEAYLYDQYQGDVSKNLKDLDTGGERPVRLSDGLLFPGFRLPTEAEWEYFNQPQFQKQLAPSNRKNTSQLPYGKKHYIYYWFNDPDEWFRPIYAPDQPTPTDRPTIPTVEDYSSKTYGLINLEGGVKEWVVDRYQEKFDPNLSDYRQIMEKSGFPLNGRILLDDDGYHVEKDSLGRMKHFRIYDITPMGEAIIFGDYFPAGESVERVVKGGTWAEFGNSRMAIPEDQARFDVGFRCVMSYAPVEAPKR